MISYSHIYLEKYGSKASLIVIKGADHQYNNSGWEKNVVIQVENYFKSELK